MGSAESVPEHNVDSNPDYNTDREDDDSVKTGGTIGGCGCPMVGGLDDVNQYDKSIYSQGKQDLIRKLAKEIGPLFGVKGLESKSIDQIHKELKKGLPDPKNNRIKKEGQSKVCDKLVTALNNVYGRKIIDMNGTAEEKCNSLISL